MAIQFELIKSTAIRQDIVVVISDKKEIKRYSFLKPYSSFLEEKAEKRKQDFFLLPDGNRKINVALFFSQEKDSSYRLEGVRSFGSKICKLINKEKYETVALFGLKEAFSKQEVVAFLEGLELTNYEFNKYKVKKKSDSLSLKKVQLLQGTLSEKEFEEQVNLTEAIFTTRDLVNEPVNVLNAPALSEEITTIGARCGFDVEVLSKAQIEALNMGGLLGVNKGSIDPPTFNILTYKPKNAVNARPLVLVGKGVVFDTGGYSLKVGGVMSTMKSDMAGAAAVVGALMAVSTNQLPVYVVGLIPATDNKISSNAVVVDDVITMHDGTTVEVQNTDAEGRLILADALSFAKKYKPELVIDLATLTGAAAAITGPYGIASMGTDKKYKETLTETGEEVYERLAEMPFWREFEDLLKSDIADLKNIGGPIGGAMTAGKFLQHFTDYNWIHLDIAGMAFNKDAKDYRPKGGTGVGVRLLYSFTKKFIQQQKKNTTKK